MKKLWEDFHERLYNFIRSRVKNEQDAEDILQEVFIKIYKKKGSLKDQGKLTSWIFQICRNTIIDYYRKSKAVETELDFDIQDEVNTEQEMCSCLMSFIEKLATPHKEIILKTSIQKQSLKGFAIESSLSYAATKSRIQRARKALKDLFLNCCMVEADKYGNILSLNQSEDCSC